MPAVIPLALDVPLPPQRLMFMGEDHAKMLSNGDGLLDLPKRLGLYQPDAPVIDIGCGYGRVGYALMRSGHRAPYLGLDILPDHVAWLRANLKPHLPPGSDFLHLDVRNERYNPGGATPATQAVLPHPDWTPGLVLMFSVFTHMHADEIQNYLGQLRSLLSRGATACVTFFLLNGESRKLQETGRNLAYTFRHRHSETCSLLDPASPLHAIAYDEGWVYGVMKENGLQVEHLAYGSWCGRTLAPTFQDTLIVRAAA